ncbi:g3950 [Coccomyxa viridis]|uniref:G3950 protein n=1 Tax=Coccomyxa viridis TaxID=1274662 RepID=A0ABP1FP34_9CHLO
MRTSTQKSVMRVAALLLLLQCSRTSQAMDLVMYHSERQDSGPGWHDLKTVKSSLERAGHKVEATRAGKMLGTLAMSFENITDFEGVLVQGKVAQEVADYAARAGVPVVRFMPENFGTEDFMVNQERPAAFVFASEADAKRFHYVEEAARIVLPLARATSKNAQAYTEIPAALQAAKARTQPAAPSPSVQQGAECDTADDGAQCKAEGAQLPRDVGLVMILKNENATIHETLTSIRDGIDYWTIVDTGSTDGTQETIKKALAGVPGKLLSEKFVDFSTTRNWALRAHGKATAYAFMLDADFVVKEPWRLRITAQRMVAECRERSVEECGKGMKVFMKLGTTGFFSNRIFPTEGLGETKAGWHYVYPVHEVPAHEQLAYMNVDCVNDVLNAPGIVVQGMQISHDKSPQRWKNLDLPLLEEERKKKPDDTRVAFYLGQTYELIGDMENALTTYQERIDMGGWQQEVFEAHLRRAKLMQKALEKDTSIDPMNDTTRDPVPDLLKALELYPERAEPYMTLSFHAEWMRDHWCDRDVDPAVCKIMQQVAAYDYARIAVNKTEGGVPGGDTLFADMAIYEYTAHEQLAITAWYVAKEFSDAFDVGMDAASKLATRFPDDNDKAENLAWFEKLRAGLKPVH